MLTSSVAPTLLNCIAGLSATYPITACNVYIGLHNGDTAPTYDGTFTEPSGNDVSYKRVALVLSTYSNSSYSFTQKWFNSAAKGTDSSGNGIVYVDNSEIIQFPEECVSYTNPVTHFGLFTSETGGTPYFIGTLSSALSVNGSESSGVVVLFRKNKLRIQMSTVADTATATGTGTAETA